MAKLKQSKLAELYARFRALPRWQQDAGFFVAGAVAAGIVALVF